jgi:hypothetical protein
MLCISKKKKTVPHPVKFIVRRLLTISVRQSSLGLAHAVQPLLGNSSYKVLHFVVVTTENCPGVITQNCPPPGVGSEEEEPPHPRGWGGAPQSLFDVSRASWSR